MQSLKSLLSMLNALRGCRVGARISTRPGRIASGLTTTPHLFNSMTAAEMLQAQADIRSDAQARLQEIRDEIALLEAEMADLEEVIDG